MRTVLFDEHVALGARMVEFEGWEMPVQYAGILAEHRHTRNAVSLFDTCHMSELWVRGTDVTRALSHALACRVKGLDVGQCRYGFLLATDGGILDDIICYRTGEAEFMIVGNAGTRHSDVSRLRERLPESILLEDSSERTAKLDLQGPASADILTYYLGMDLSGLPYFGFTTASWEDSEIIISRTGYTGELGFELYVPDERVRSMWKGLLDCGGVKPAGLGARDTLRLEMGLPLYGHELDPSVTPIEPGLERFLPACDYVGAEAVEARRRKGPDRQLVGVKLEGRRAAREGDRVYYDQKPAGKVTSGSFAPSVGRAVAMAYVAPHCATEGTTVRVQVRSKHLPGTVTGLPFYRRGTARKEMRQESRR